MGENMRHQSVSRPIGTEAVISIAAPAATQPAIQAGDAAPGANATTPGSPTVAAQPGARSIAHHLQSAWRVRQFAGSRYFGSTTVPRLRNPTEVAAVERALDRLGPFGNDRIDNCGRLHAAIISGNAASAEAVITLVRHRIIHPDQRGADGDTLLHSLVEHGRHGPADRMLDANAETIDLKERFTRLFAASANPHATDRHGRTVFERCLASNRPDWQPVATALLEASPVELHLRKVSDGPTLLHRAARHGDVELVGRWLALGLPTDIGIKSWRGMNDVEVRTPLRRALKNPSLEGLEIARMLLAAGADPLRHSPWIGNTMLHRAACDADMQLLKGWIAADLPLNTPTRDPLRLTALMQAVFHHPKRADFLALLCQGDHINATNAFGQTALHYAASAPKRSAAVDTLIAAGANLDIQANNGKSAAELGVQVALDTNDDSVFWKLVTNGANVDLVNPVTGDTARRFYNRTSFRWNGAPLP